MGESISTSHDSSPEPHPGEVVRVNHPPGELTVRELPVEHEAYSDYSINNEKNGGAEEISMSRIGVDVTFGE